MDRTPASEPYPPTAPPPASTPRTPSGISALIAVGGALITIGGFLPRAKLTIGPLYVKTEGVAWLPVLTGILILVLAFTLRNRAGAVVLLVVSGLALLLTIAAMSNVKSELEHWAVTTGASQVAAQFSVSATTVAARIQALIDSGASHLTYQVGLYMTLVGSILALIASVMGLFSQRSSKPEFVSAGMSIPTAPAPPRAPDAGLPGDWTAPPSGWTDPASSAPAAPPSAPPPAQPATPAPQTAPPEEPESFPPPPPPPPPS